MATEDFKFTTEDTGPGDPGLWGTRYSPGKDVKLRLLK